VWSALHEPTFKNSVFLSGKFQGSFAAWVATFCRLRWPLCPVCRNRQIWPVNLFLWPAHRFETSSWLPHRLPAPTHQTVLSERWRCSCFNEWVSCCSWQHLWGTVLEGDYNKAYNIKINIIHCSLSTHYVISVLYKLLLIYLQDSSLI